MEFTPLASDTDSGLRFRVVRRIHASCITEVGNITSSSVYAWLKVYLWPKPSRGMAETEIPKPKSETNAEIRNYGQNFI